MLAALRQNATHGSTSRMRGHKNFPILARGEEDALHVAVGD